MKEKIWFGCLAALCAAGILWGAWALAAPVLPAPAPLDDTADDTAAGAVYYLRDSGGRVAVYARAGDETPLAVYDIYVNLLPESDALRLKNGIAVAGAAELQRLLEDLGA